MKHVIVKRETASQLYRAFVDQREVTFVGDEAVAEVETGEHSLTWVVEGPRGSSYRIAITTPAEAKFDRTATFDSSEKTRASIGSRCADVIARVVAAAAVLVWACAGAVCAQERAERATVEALPAAQDPSASSVMVSPPAVAILEGTAKGKTATARIGIQSRDLLLDLKLSGPLDDHETQLASLRGLAGSTTLSAGLGWIRWHPTPDPVRMQAVCDAYTRRTGTALRDCAHLDLPEGRWRRRFDNAVHFGTPLLLSLRGTIGSRSFTWIDTTTPGVRLGEAHRRLGGCVGRGVSQRHRFLPALLGLRGIVVGGRSGADLPAPRRQRGAAVRRPAGAEPRPRRQLAGQLRVPPPHRNGRRIRPTVTYRTASRIWGVQLPLYFLRDQQGLTGGVSLGWRSDSREAA